MDLNLERGEQTFDSTQITLLRTMSMEGWRRNRQLSRRGRRWKGGSETGRKLDSKENQNSSSHMPFTHQALVEPFLESAGTTRGQRYGQVDKDQMVFEVEQTRPGARNVWAKPTRSLEIGLETTSATTLLILMSSPMEVGLESQATFRPHHS